MLKHCALLIAAAYCLSNVCVSHCVSNVRTLGPSAAKLPVSCISSRVRATAIFQLPSSHMALVVGHEAHTRPQVQCFAELPSDATNLT